ncbi:CesT family type III secretion system chaperone [Erwinia oleae]|uniref:CesT family type III secretion system chaperone n=1 Tax=Erwinia oleae TaxID=796334 RepID=UPI0005506F09|nr:CesT family type III secretion system chaperone [Erwinia oleae]
MSNPFSDLLHPLFSYLKTGNEIRGDEQAFELVMWSDLSLRILHYPDDHITLSCMISFRADEETAANTLWELLQVNLMDELSPPIVLAASANSEEIVVWSRLPIGAAEPQALIALYERMAFYTHTLGRRLGVVSQPDPVETKGA